jgi:hypothetical protein
VEDVLSQPAPQAASVASQRNEDLRPIMVQGLIGLADADLEQFAVLLAGTKQSTGKAVFTMSHAGAT